jgi:cell wall-associated NlpC family hydrolase
MIDLMTQFQVCPPGVSAQDPKPGDFLLCHRTGFASSCIRWGERLKYRDGSRWSHAALIETPTTIIEALTTGVVRNALSEYDDTLYVLVRTELDELDAEQAVFFAQRSIGVEYGFLTDFGIFLRFVTPGRGLWFGSDGTEICSGLVAQALTRGWADFIVNPASISPAELAEYYQVAANSKAARL